MISVKKYQKKHYRPIIEKNKRKPGWGLGWGEGGRSLAGTGGSRVFGEEKTY